MKIYLLDTNKTMTKAWEHDFGNVVTVVNDTLENFLNTNKDVEAVVSPGNSKGVMDGGYDKAISLYFGWGLTNHIQKYIARECPKGLQKVATALIFDIPETTKKCIHVPTMVHPAPIDDPKVIYHCMKATLECALTNNVKSVVIPAFCAGVGGVDPFTVSEQMLLAYNEVMTK